MTIPAETVALMHAEYSTGVSLCEVARRHGKDRKSLREIFTRRGLPVRTTRVFKHRYANGQIMPAKPLTERQIDALIVKATKLRVPDALAREWRKWPLEKRGSFIARLRTRLRSPRDRPSAPFSANVTPFDYATPAARAIVAAANAGKNSRKAGIKIDACSQGVIYKGRLWFWGHKIGYQLGLWTPGLGRPALHHVIWEEAHGRAVPAGHCVIHRDGNPNNLAPENLALISRDENCRRNHVAGLLRKSRERTRLLLALSRKKKGTHHDTARSILKTRNV